MTTAETEPRHRADRGQSSAPTKAAPTKAAPTTQRVPARRGRQLTNRLTSPRVTATPALSRRQRVQLAGLVVLWVGFTVSFWVWWLQPAHIGNPVLFGVVSASFFYIATILPSFYIFYLSQMRYPALPSASRARSDQLVPGDVAVITLTVPGSESLDIVERQLVAMAAIRHAHDSWVLVDKIHSPEIERLAIAAGVRYFSRHDAGHWGQATVDRWNAPAPPFQAKTKAGNVNAWLDAHGSEYSHFTQLDIDHNPKPEYLDRVLPYFADRAVAWVQAPSVYGNHEHWTARGSTEQELVLQGPLQMGFFGYSRTPMIIGSHCTYDRAAIDQIGGFAPTRAEDHLDTVLLAAQGREGVFLPEVLAVGDGPETFETYLAQQFAWAYSMFQVLFRYTPRLVREYTARQALQFLFVQTWYLLWSLSMLALFVAPLAALAFDVSISHVQLGWFYLHSVPLGLTATLTWWWSRKWFQPDGVSLSWRGIVLHIARWVVVVSALIQVILRVQKPYMITVKGMSERGLAPYGLRPLAPYFGLAGLALASCWFYLGVHDRSGNQGYLYFAVLGAALFAVMIAVVVRQELTIRRRSGASGTAALRSCARALTATVALAAGIGITACFCASRVVDAFVS